MLYPLLDPTSGSPPPALRPVLGSERIALLDVLRGFALAGVLIANLIPWFAATQLMAPDARAVLPFTDLNEVVRLLVRFAVDLKFLSILSFLFGIGAGLQFGKAAGQPLTGAYVRRLGALFVIGLLHAALLWWGDVLHLFALVGLLLVAFNRLSDTKLLLSGLAAGILIPGVIWTGNFILMMYFDVSVFPETEPVEEQMVAAFTGGTYPEVVYWNWTYFVQSLLHHGNFEMVFCMLGMALLGLWTVRRGWIEQMQQRPDLLKKALGWSLALGVFGSGLWAGFSGLIRAGLVAPVSLWFQFSAILFKLGIVALALFYVCLIVFLYRKPEWQARLRVFAPAGRMALTNYLAQSLLGMFVFYGFGLGLIGKVGAGVCVPIWLALLGLQLAGSAWWMRRYRFGPIEWLWRSITYGRLQPMRRAKQVPAWSPGDHPIGGAAGPGPAEAPAVVPAAPVARPLHRSSSLAARCST